MGLSDSSIAHAYCKDSNGWETYEGEWVCAPNKLYQDSDYAPHPSYRKCTEHESDISIYTWLLIRNVLKVQKKQER